MGSPAHLTLLVLGHTAMLLTLTAAMGTMLRLTMDMGRNMVRMLWLS